MKKKEVILVILSSLLIGFTLGATTFNVKLQKAEDVIRTSVNLLYECENCIDELTDGAYGDTIAEGDSFSEFQIAYHSLYGKWY